MTVITKADLAREIGVSKSRVSQYVKSGLPVRSDGKLDREAALTHLRMYRVSDVGSTKGPVRAKHLLETGPQVYVAADEQPYSETFRKRASEADKAAVTVLHQLLVKSRRMMARAAIECGASLEVAYNLTDFLHADLAEAAHDVLHARGTRAFNGPGLGVMDQCLGPEPSWEQYADAIGEAFDKQAFDDAFDDLQAITLAPRLGGVVEG